MAMQKLFIGRKIRSLREANKATQSQFADRIGISTSYLNQIENNHRPVSAAVLVALVDKFQIDLSELSAGEGDRLLSALSEALTDPLFDGNPTNLQELKLITQNAPSLAHALVRAHQAYRRSSEQLASLNDSMGRSTLASEATPYEEVRDFFHFVDNYIHDLDVQAEKLAIELGLEHDDRHAALTGYLQRVHKIRVVRAEPGRDILRHFDAKTRILSLNAYIPATSRDFQLALQIAQLQAAQTVDKVVKSGNFRTREAEDICRIGLHNYFAGALLFPYKAFLSAAKTLRHDLELLASRFGASLEQVCHRLSTLQRPGEKGVPVFFARVDRAGNITKRHSATKLQFARFGAACPLWNVHQAFEAHGRIIRQLAETPDGARYLCLATQITKGGGGFNSAQPQYAIAFGCEISYASAFVYADELDLSNRSSFEPIGISCRLCERTQCFQRAVPPVMRKLHVDHDMRTILPYSIGDS